MEEQQEFLHGSMFQAASTIRKHRIKIIIILIGLLNITFNIIQQIRTYPCKSFDSKVNYEECVYGRSYDQTDDYHDYFEMDNSTLGLFLCFTTKGPFIVLQRNDDIEFHMNVAQFRDLFDETSLSNIEHHLKYIPKKVIIIIHVLFIHMALIFVF